MSIFRISAPDGLFMAVGNHEYISGIDAVERFIDKTDITLLRDSVARIGTDSELVVIVLQPE